MTTPCTIRPPKSSDVHTLAGFQIAMARETENKKLDTEVVERAVGRVLKDPSLGRYLVAERAGEVVGSLMLTHEWSDWRDASWWWIQSVFIPEPARRTGVYRALYDAVRQQAKQAGVRGIRLYVEVENAKAQATYEALGMRRCPYAMYEVDLA